MLDPRAVSIRTIRERILEHHPDLVEKFRRTEELNGPMTWAGLLGVCDRAYHKEREHAVVHDRMHTQEMYDAERTLGHWDTVDNLQRFSLYVFLQWLRRKRLFDLEVDRTLHDAVAHVLHPTPPTSTD